jgi:hypothetical protein
MEKKLPKRPMISIDLLDWELWREARAKRDMTGVSLSFTVREAVKAWVQGSARPVAGDEKDG